MPRIRSAFVDSTCSTSIWLSHCFPQILRPGVHRARVIDAIKAGIRPVERHPPPGAIRASIETGSAPRVVGVGGVGGQLDQHTCVVSGAGRSDYEEHLTGNGQVGMTVAAVVLAPHDHAVVSRRPCVRDDDLQSRGPSASVRGSILGNRVFAAAQAIAMPHHEPLRTDSGDFQGEHVDIR